MKEFRITIYVNGKDIPGAWIKYTVQTFNAMCEAFAENECMFLVEFQ